MANLLPNIVAQFFDDYGKPLAGGRVYTYESGTTIKKKTYVDREGKTPHSNPISLDASGCANIFLGEGLYRIRVVDCNETLIHDTNDISRYVDNIELQQFIKTVQGGIQALEQASEQIDLTVSEKLDAQKGYAGGITPLNKNGKINPMYLEVVDSLESESPTDILSANQGRILKEQIDTGLEKFSITGEPPVFGCRAWCNFNGLTLEKIAGGNIKSIERTAEVGAYTVTFETPMPSNNYAVVFGGFYGSFEQQNRQTVLKINNQTTEQIQIVNVYLPTDNGANLRDSQQIMFAVFC